MFQSLKSKFHTVTLQYIFKRSGKE